MQSRNPVFARSDEFNGQQTMQRNDPTQWRMDTDASTGPSTVDSRRMSIDTVVEKTAFTLGLLVVFAGIAWIAIGNVVVGGYYDQSALNTALMLSFVGDFARIVHVSDDYT